MVTKTEIYDTVQVQTLEVGDRIEFAGYTMRVDNIYDTGLWLYLDLYNEDTDEDLEEEPFAANVMVGLVHEVDSEDEAE